MIDRFADVRKTFNDYQQESAISLSKIYIKSTHPWKDCKIKEINISDNALILVILRNGKKIVPKGNVQIKEGDEILLGTTVVNSTADVYLCETHIDRGHEWINQSIKMIDCPGNFLIVLVKRDGNYFVPNGNTKILLNDTIIFHES